MNLRYTVATGLRGLTGHRLRSVLTTLGILFGIAAVICTVGIGQASADSVNARIASLGTNLLTISPGSTSSGGVSGGAASASTLTMTDARGLANKDNCPDVSAVAPVVQSRATLIDGAQNWSTTINGTTDAWLAANGRSMSSGSFITPNEVQAHTHVVDLGATTASDLGASVGDTVQIGTSPFTVIGILASAGGSGFTNQDDLAVIPVTTAHDVLTGGNPNSVQRILLSAASSDVIGSAYQEATQLLLQTHDISTPSSADFTIQSQSSFLSTAQSVTTTLTILLSSVAAISLLVGGIGVMNIMLVSVTERTSEIGLRKAVGATPGDILKQFLVESATLSLLGGLLGVALAFLVSVVLPRVSTIGVAITLLPVVIAVVAAAAVGLIFGVYPAIRAARLLPIQALRSSQ